MQVGAARPFVGARCSAKEMRVTLDRSTLNSLVERLQKLEDVTAITQLIASYGPVADTCDRDGLEQI